MDRLVRAASPVRKIAKDTPGGNAVEAGVRRRRWTVNEFDRIADAGVFAPDERLELLNGDVFEKVSPQKSAHAFAILDALDVLRGIFGSNVDIRPQLPIRLSDNTQPEPDIAVVPRSRRAHPIPKDVWLLLEISDTTMTYDRSNKAETYAKEGVEEYWILNIQELRLEVHRDPAVLISAPFGFGYRNILSLTPEESIAPLHAPRLRVKVADLLRSSLEDAALEEGAGMFPSDTEPGL